MDFGELRHRVTLDNPSAPTGDGDGGAARLWPPDGGVQLGARLPAAVDPGAAQGLERSVAKTTEGVGTFTIRLRYLAGVTLETRVTFHDGPTDRTLWVTGVADEAQRHVLLALTCQERVA
jgi:head-tail adaptor